jgi:hypothetical protein
MMFQCINASISTEVLAKVSTYQLKEINLQYLLRK